METGYIFLDLVPRTKRDFMTKLKEIEAVKEAQLVIGIYDAIARIEAKNIEELEKIYFNEIETIAGIINSRLQIVACPRARK